MCHNRYPIRTDTHPMWPSAEGCRLCICCQFVTEPRPDPPNPDRDDRSQLRENSEGENTRTPLNRSCVKSEPLFRCCIAVLITCAIWWGQSRWIHPLPWQSLSGDGHGRSGQSLSVLRVIYSLVLQRGEEPVGHTFTHFKNMWPCENTPQCKVTIQYSCK